MAGAECAARPQLPFPHSPLRGARGPCSAGALPNPDVASAGATCSGLSDLACGLLSALALSPWSRPQAWGGPAEDTGLLFRQLWPRWQEEAAGLESGRNLEAPDGRQSGGVGAP
ncbi:hypothetical protein P7K49_024280 [Saguinus oedipus]|uniref:Uncharacterized protein n=1 Tax=Saguinus oedipus TaxID=9490 RepID=A0ABQ9UPW2_SAGOE|nr:hypothetical protein P7K49_024280 [Saguinus oedipus]